MKNPIDKLSDKLTKYLVKKGADEFNAKIIAETIVYTSAISLAVILVFGIFILN